jgi:hypothetical protein
MLLRKFRQYWASVLIVLGIAFLCVFLTEQVNLVDRRLTIYAPALFTTLGLQLIFWWVTVFNWRLVLSATTSTTISFPHGFGHILITTLGKYLPGKIWGLVARGAILRRNGVVAEKSATALYYEFILNIYTALLVAAVASSMLYPSWYTMGLGLGAVLSIPVLPYFQGAILGIFRPYLHKINKNINPDHSQALKLSNYYLILLTSSLTWITSGCILAGVLLTFFKADLSTNLFLTLVLANTIGILAGFFALFAPGGIGVREALSSSILASVMPLPDAIALVIIFRLWVMGSELLGGILSIYVLRDFLNPKSP